MHFTVYWRAKKLSKQTLINMGKWLFNRPWELEPSPTRTIFQFPSEFELTNVLLQAPRQGSLNFIRLLRVVITRWEEKTTRSNRMNFRLLGRVATAWLQSWRSIIVPKRSSHRLTVHISYFSVWLSRSRAAVLNSLGELKLGGAQRPRWMGGQVIHRVHK